MPSTTAMALAPAEPSVISSASSAWAMMTAAAGGRDLLTTRRGCPLCGAGRSGSGSVHSVCPTAGSATAPAVGTPFSTRATCTAQSDRPGSEYSRVPSSGSTIQTRSADKRARSSRPSSERMASSGRASASRFTMCRWASESPVSRTSQVPAPELKSLSRTSTSSAPVSVATLAARAWSSGWAIDQVCPLHVPATRPRRARRSS